MADTDVWGLGGPIAAPAAADRIPIATGPNSGGYSPRGDFISRIGGKFAGNVDGNGYAQALYLERQSTGAPWIATAIGLDPATQLTYFHSAGSANGGFVWQNSGELMRLTSGGNLGVGASSPGARLHVRSFHEVMRLEGTTPRGGGDNYIQFNDPLGAAGYFGYCSATSSMEVWNNLNAPFNVYTDNLISLRVDRASIRAGADNITSSGSASVRWSTGYFGSNPIVTCDVQFKLFRIGRDITAAEHAAALECFEVFGFFQFLDAIAAKGVDGARMHFGPGAQEVWSIFAAHGLVEALVENDKGELVPVDGSVPPACLCFDKIEEERAPVMEGWRPSSLLGPDGEPIMVKCADDEEATEQRPTGETIVTREAGHIFGVRIDQLQSLMLVALNRERKTTAATIAALAARIALLEPA